MRGWLYALTLLSLIFLCGCGNNNNATSNVGLFGYWNIVMCPTNDTNPVYVFALAMSQEGSNNYRGGSITYTGSVTAPTNMCINPKSLNAAATTNSNNYTMPITDTSTDTVIAVNGSLLSQTGSLIRHLHQCRQPVVSGESGNDGHGTPAVIPGQKFDVLSAFATANSACAGEFGPHPHLRPSPRATQPSPRSKG